jgi:hypothetical protein
MTHHQEDRGAGRVVGGTEGKVASEAGICVGMPVSPDFKVHKHDGIEFR